jgi:hypothetical protein
MKPYRIAAVQKSLAFSLCALRAGTLSCNHAGKHEFVMWQDRAALIPKERG